jgi:hypothetical protein
LNGEGGRGDQWGTSRGFALDKFVHVTGVRRYLREINEARQVFTTLRVMGQATSQFFGSALGSDGCQMGV